MSRLKLSESISLPLDAVTQTFLIVGKRGSGKSNTAARFVEQLHRNKLPFVVLDPVDTWWGLKAGRDGGKGLDVYVFGGRHQDLPLEATSGALIAEVLCEHRMPMVLSVKHLSGRERSGFMVKFAQTLFQKWGGGPLHVVLEEAHELAPQMSGSRSGSEDNEAAMLGAFKRLWKLGRASGIGGTAVTQRPASLSKDITTQSEILIAHRTIGPQDVKAIGEWVKYHGEHVDMLTELPSMPTGEAFIWAPEFPEGKPLGLQRTAVLLRETYDSASTPKVGEQRVEPKELAAVDLERLRAKMAATMEKAKAEDPRELRKTIAILQQELKSSRASETLTASVRVKEKVVPALTDADRELLKSLRDEWLIFTESIADKADAMLTSLAERAKAEIDRAAEVWVGNIDKRRALFTARLEGAGVQRVLGKISALSSAPTPASVTTPATIYHKGHATGHAAAPIRQASVTKHVATPDGGPLPPGEHATLTATLQYPTGLDRKRLGILTGYKRSSRDAYINRLQQKGLVDVRGALLYATDAGRHTLNGSFEPLPTGADLIEYWRERLPEGERKTLDVLIAATGAEVGREAIDEATGYKRSSRDAYLVRLKARGLVEFVGRGMVRASDELFS